MSQAKPSTIHIEDLEITGAVTHKLYAVSITFERCHLQVMSQAWWKVPEGIHAHYHQSLLG
jgi:hypothetical protein